MSKPALILNIIHLDILCKNPLPEREGKPPVGVLQQ